MSGNGPTGHEYEDARADQARIERGPANSTMAQQLGGIDQAQTSQIIGGTFNGVQEQGYGYANPHGPQSFLSPRNAHGSAFQQLGAQQHTPLNPRVAYAQAQAPRPNSRGSNTMQQDPSHQPLRNRRLAVQPQISSVRPPQSSQLSTPSYPSPPSGPRSLHPPVYGRFPPLTSGPSALTPQARLPSTQYPSSSYTSPFRSDIGPAESAGPAAAVPAQVGVNTGIPEHLGHSGSEQPLLTTNISALPPAISHSQRLSDSVVSQRYTDSRPDILSSRVRRPAPAPGNHLEVIAPRNPQDSLYPSLPTELSTWQWILMELSRQEALLASPSGAALTPAPPQAQLQNYAVVPASGLPPDSECDICYEPYSSNGDHVAIQLEAVGCSHIFGRSCLAEWVNCRMNNAHLCPKCRRSLDPCLGAPQPRLPPRGRRAPTPSLSSTSPSGIPDQAYPDQIGPDHLNRLRSQIRATIRDFTSNGAAAAVADPSTSLSVPRASTSQLGFAPRPSSAVYPMSETTNATTASSFSGNHLVHSDVNRNRFAQDFVRPTSNSSSNVRMSPELTRLITMTPERRERIFQRITGLRERIQEERRRLGHAAEEWNSSVMGPRGS